MLTRHTRFVGSSALVVFLSACSAQSPAPGNAAPATPAAQPAAAPRPDAPAPQLASGTQPAAAQPAATPVTPEAPAPGGPSAPATEPAPAPATTAVPTPAPEPAYHEVTLPTGTSLPIDLKTAVASDTSQVEDHVRATLRQPVSVRGVEVLPAGTVLAGHVTEAARSGKVKGRARVSFRFTSLDPPGDGGRTAIRTSAIVREAETTKKQDAAKIGGGAAGGALIGAILGGGGGAAKGAAIGGAGGTGVVLATRGKEVRLPAGTNLIVSLQAPVTIRVRR